MTPMLADFSTGEIVSNAIAFGALIIMLISMLRKSDVKVEQPLDVHLVESLVSKNDFRDHVRQDQETHDQLFAKIGGMTRGADSKISSEITAVHVRVNAIEKSIGGLEMATNLQNQQLAGMDAKITRLLERRTSHES